MKRRIVSFVLALVMCVSLLPARAFAATVLAIDIGTAPTKLVYLQGEALDLTGGELTVYQDDGEVSAAITADMVSGFDSSVPGRQTLTVTYEGTTCTFDVRILPEAGLYIEVTTKPAKLVYAKGQALDVTGGQLTLYRIDGETSAALTADMVTGFDSSVLGKQTLTVTYEGVTTTFQVEVCEMVKSVSILTKPSQTKYLLNVDALNVEGGVLKVTYYDDTTGKVPMTADMVTGFDNTVLGRQRLTVMYEGRKATFYVAICENNTSEFFSGLGTAERPYLIKTKEHLNNVRKYTSAHYRMVEDIVFTEADFTKGGDFYNDGSGWQPIPTAYSNYFTGSFDGNGHTIQGLKISGRGDYVGLFGYILGGTVANLGIEDCVLQTSGSFSYIGAIAGRVSGGTISNCYNTGSITGSQYAGGIAGYVENSTTISDCYNAGSITGDSDAGGIAGFASGTISDCYNTGIVTADLNADPKAGGIVGEIKNGTVSNCYNTGSVAAAEYAGGIAGRVWATIRNCYNTGIVTATAYSRAYAGGVAGEVWGSGTISDCYNTGIVTATSVASWPSAGGIAGYVTSCTISNCYNTGSITSDDHAGGGIVGGVYTNSTISNCYYLNTIERGSGSTTACTLEQMKQQATFAGFDFDTVWTMTGDGNYLLPRLQSVAMVETHRFTDYVSDNNATATEDGTKTAVCDYCSKTDTVVDEGSAGSLSGWVLEEGIWYYYQNAEKATGWLPDGNRWFYLGTDGAMQTGWQLISGVWFYLGTDGVMRTGWQLVSGSWYYLDANGAMQTGWLLDGGSWYYLNSGGIMQTGWLLDGGSWYYLSSGGIMQTGWLLDGGSWYYLNSGGIMQTGWLLDGSSWYYLGADGIMKTGWFYDGWAWYYLSDSGILYTGWLLDSGRWFYLTEGGAMAANTTMVIDGHTYTFDAGGVMVSQG